LSRGRLSLPLRVGLVDAFLYWSVSFLFKLVCLLEHSRVGWNR